MSCTSFHDDELFFFFFKAEDGIRYLVRSRGLGDVYKRQAYAYTVILEEGLSHAAYTRGLGAEPIVFRLDGNLTLNPFDTRRLPLGSFQRSTLTLSLIHI